MRGESLLSVGIDVGTSTTQCVFSRIGLSNVAPPFAVPKVEITEKTVLRRSRLHLTPLSGPDAIDAEGLRDMIKEDYREAGVSPGEIGCGCVMITGETARKENAKAVAQALSALAGDFVVATAGPDLEAILAGRGSGAADMSREPRKRVMNLDIGGGTTNICLFEAGEPAATGSLDIGGRLLRFESGSTVVLSASPKLLRVAGDIGLDIRAGARLPEGDISRLTERMAQVIEEEAHFRPRTALHDALVLSSSLPPDRRADIYTFSGGVGGCVYGEKNGDIEFDDIGERLARALRGTACFREGRVLRPRETQQATVIGAGTYSMTVSGSTIQYSGMDFPIRDLPAGRIRLSGPEDIPRVAERAREQLRVFGGDCAIAFEGLASPTYAHIERAAEQLAIALADAQMRVVIMERDMAKALGQALMRRLNGAPLLCADGVRLSHGDLIDIGAPIALGRALPVVVKTLIFSA